MEAQLSEWVAENDSRLPIVAFMAGKFMDDEEMQGMSFGHAGTIVEGKEDTATEKIARLEAAGIRVVERIDEIPDAVKERLGAPDEPGSALHGIFIDVEVDDSVAATPSWRRSWRRSARSTSSAPPTGGVEIVEENLDECVLCDLCVEAAPRARCASSSSTRSRSRRPGSGRLRRREPDRGPARAVPGLEARGDRGRRARVSGATGTSAS